MTCSSSLALAATLLCTLLAGGTCGRELQQSYASAFASSSGKGAICRKGITLIPPHAQ